MNAVSTGGVSPYTSAASMTALHLAPAPTTTRSDAMLWIVFSVLMSMTTPPCTIGRP
jgi:hypothetical protein